LWIEDISHAECHKRKLKITGEDGRKFDDLKSKRKSLLEIRGNLITIYILVICGVAYNKYFV
jgi:hypothetical protein